MAEDFGSGKTEASFLLVFIGIGSSIGRLVFGRIADLKWCNRLNLCQITLLCIGVASTLIPLVESYVFLAFYAFVFGLLEGSYIVINPVITGDLVGKEKLPSALGMSFFMMAFPKSVGPPIAGWIYDLSQRYDNAFLYMGAVTILACCMMFAVPLLTPVHHDDVRLDATSCVRETNV